MGSNYSPVPTIHHSGEEFVSKVFLTESELSAIKKFKVYGRRMDPINYYECEIYWIGTGGRSLTTGSLYDRIREEIILHKLKEPSD